MRELDLPSLREAVAALDADAGICHVITAYIPDIERFGADYKTRRRRT